MVGCHVGARGPYEARDGQPRRAAERSGYRLAASSATGAVFFGPRIRGSEAEDGSIIGDAAAVADGTVVVHDFLNGKRSPLSDKH